MRLCLAVLFFMQLSLHESVQAFMSDKYDYYAEIDRHLRSQIDSADPKKNLAIAEKYLEEREASSCVSKAFQRGFLKTLRGFVSLNEITKVNSCTYVSYERLARNDPVRHFKVDPKHPFLDRVSSVVDALAKKHAENCWDNYPELLQLHLGKLDQTKRRSVEMFTNGVIHLSNTGNKYADEKSLPPFDIVQKHCQKTPQKSEHERFQIPEHLSGWGTAQIAYATIDEMIREKGDSQAPRARAKRARRIMDLINEFILEPCREFNRGPGYEVMAPAKFDRKTKSLATFDNEALSLNWARFRICEYLLGGPTYYLEVKVARLQQLDSYGPKE